MWWSSELGQQGAVGHWQSWVCWENSGCTGVRWIRPEWSLQSMAEHKPGEGGHQGLAVPQAPLQLEASMCL